MADDHHPASPLEALNARGLTAKREYVRGLEQRHDPEALSLLTECLCDESWFLRDLAEQTFFRLGEAHADALVPLLAGGLWYTRLSAARLLGRLGYRPAVPALLELCDDTSETVVAAAREAIIAIARQRGAARIAHALHRLTPAPRQRRLAEVAERDRALAKNLERLMADVDLMAEDHPDRMTDPEEPAAAPRPAGAPKAPRPAPAAKSPATSSPPPASTPRPKPPAAAAGGAPKPRPPRAPAGPVPGATSKPPAPPASAPPGPAALPKPPSPEPQQTAPQPELPAPAPSPATPGSALPPRATSPSASQAPDSPEPPEPGEARSGN